MRLTDADSIVKYIEELKTPDAPLIARIVLDNIELFVKNAPSILAINVEQVAKMLYTVAEKPPCKTDFFEEYDKFTCTTNENCCMIDSCQECWLHAIKEGWLNDES